MWMAGFYEKVEKQAIKKLNNCLSVKLCKEIEQLA